MRVFVCDSKLPLRTKTECWISGRGGINTQIAFGVTSGKRADLSHRES